MLPSIAIVDSVEMIRDGGSLAALFRGPDGCQYSLFLALRTRDLPAGAVERVGYAEPIIVNRLTGLADPISWQHADIFLNQIGRLIEPEHDMKWLAIMRDVVSTKGQLPQGIQKVLYPCHSF